MFQELLNLVVISNKEKSNDLPIPLKQNARGQAYAKFPKRSAQLLKPESHREASSFEGPDKGINVSLDFHPLGGMEAP